MNNIKIGIIGGSGINDVIEVETYKNVHTPYGTPSGELLIGTIQGKKVVFLPRHGTKHTIPPHMINYRANIYALHSVGVEKIIGLSAVGSLKKSYVPGDLVTIDQFIDFTKSRKYTYFDGPVVAHISMADPFCPALRQIVVDTGAKLGITVHSKGTYICIEGPRFSTRAESKMFRTFGDVIGMTLVPEVTLARELGMCYLAIASVTDYDVWADTPVTTEEVLKVMKENEVKVKKIIRDAIEKIVTEDRCSCQKEITIAKVK